MKPERIESLLQEGLVVHQRLAGEFQPAILAIAGLLAGRLRAGGKILLCGNGGSAADAQHVAAEIVGRYVRERRGWPAIALTTDASILTALGNDYGYESIFRRQVEALAKPGDVVVGISTSGASPNVVAALEEARRIGAYTVAFTGEGGGKIADIADLSLSAPSKKTANIQEAHIVCWHIICDLIEEELTEG